MRDNIFPSPAWQGQLDLYDYARGSSGVPDAPRLRRAGRTAEDGRELNVSDDWPDRIPVTDVELDVFEVQFGALLDELLRQI
ncbi:hypothetical protein AB4Z43_00830 [Mesorhizobium sp. 2RAF45]|uniref:hypothetical protein n=1 Tax=Mesorhizobium sp. 2RAF45 TaxID=3233001 RepID=UPI003F95B93C